MKRLISFFKSSMLRWWFMITAILSVSSTCPCCGKPACPIGTGYAAIISLIVVSTMKITLKAKEFLFRLIKLVKLIVKRRGYK